MDERGETQAGRKEVSRQSHIPASLFSYLDPLVVPAGFSVREVCWLVSVLLVSVKWLDGWFDGERKDGEH